MAEPRVELTHDFDIKGEALAVQLVVTREKTFVRVTNSGEVIRRWSGKTGRPVTVEQITAAMNLTLAHFPMEGSPGHDLCLQLPDTLFAMMLEASNLWVKALEEEARLASFIPERTSIMWSHDRKVGF